MPKFPKDAALNYTAAKGETGQRGLIDRGRGYRFIDGWTASVCRKRTSTFRV